MAVSVVEICNLALSLIGGENISSMSEASAQARASNQFYQTTRDGLLALYPWGFAQKLRVLPEVGNDKAGTWAHAYDLPVDMLKVGLVRPAYSADLGVFEGEQAQAAFLHHVEGDKIYSDVEGAVLLYTARVEDPSLYPPLFVSALAYSLAAWLAMPLTRSVEIQGRMMQLAQGAQASAMAADAGNMAHFDTSIGAFERARL